MSSFDAETLVRQLAQLGRDLQAEVIHLGLLEEVAVEAEGEFCRLKEEHEDALAQAFLVFDGTVDVRKAQARIKCIPSRLMAQDASLDKDRAKAKVRTQQASLSALHRRCEIGRSLLSREKSLLSLVSSGIDVL